MGMVASLIWKLFNHLANIFINILLILLSCLAEFKALVVCFFINICNPPTQKNQPGSSESVQQQLHLAYGTTEANGGPNSADGSSISLPTNTPPPPPHPPFLPGLHIRQMSLTFTQLSTLQRREIYSASGRDWSQVST